MDAPDQVSVLLSALGERYEAMRTIRSRVQQVTVWTMALFFGATGWLISTQQTFPWATKTAFIAALAVEFGLIRFYYLADLASGFQSQQIVAARIEKALGLFTDGSFGISDSIYPISWSRAGQVSGQGNYFKSNYSLIHFATAALAVTVLTKGILF